MADDFTKDYNAQSIQVLEGLEPVRKRPGMYIGSTDAKGFRHMLIEIIDNSLDEAIAGFAKNIWVSLLPDGKAMVTDDGRGIPIDVNPKYKKSAMELAMTKLHAGAKFDNRAYQASGGLHGVGASVVNALSSWMRAEIYRDSKIYCQEYKRGKAVEDVKVCGKTEKEGTRIIFEPDGSIFKTIPTPPPNGLSSTVWCLSVAHLRKLWMLIFMTPLFNARDKMASFKKLSKKFGKIVMISNCINNKPRGPRAQVPRGETHSGPPAVRRAVPWTF